ncbi:MAG: hypothetical protein ABSF28_09890 [Terracidiphilus sp.]
MRPAVIPVTTNAASGRTTNRMIPSALMHAIFSVSGTEFKENGAGKYAIFSGMDEKRELMRHVLATVAYRAARALDGAPEGFANFDGAGRRPEQILAHMGDLFDWALSVAEGDQRWAPVPPRGWAEEKQRFFASLTALDAYLASDQPLNAPLERLLQGPVTDALTHVGQLAMMRRLAGSPTCGENFYVAEIAVGQVGAEQPAAVQPFK